MGYKDLDSNLFHYIEHHETNICKNFILKSNGKDENFPRQAHEIALTVYQYILQDRK